MKNQTRSKQINYRYKLVASFRLEAASRDEPVNRFFSSNVITLAQAASLPEALAIVSKYSFLHEYIPNVSMSDAHGFLVFNTLRTAQTFAEAAFPYRERLFAIFKCEVDHQMKLPMSIWPRHTFRYDGDRNLNTARLQVMEDTLQDDGVLSDYQHKDFIRIQTFPPDTQRWKTIKLIQDVTKGE